MSTTTIPDLASGSSTIVTAEQHILLQQRQYSPEATGSFSWLLSGITLATKLTEARVRRAGLLDVLGTFDDDLLQHKGQLGYVMPIGPGHDE